MIAAPLAEYPLIVAGIIGALMVIGKATHWVYEWTKRIDATLEYVSHEMRYNGGATMRDAIKRIDERMAALETAGIEVHARNVTIDTPWHEGGDKRGTHSEQTRHEH